MIRSSMILISCTHIRHNSCIPYLKRLRQGTYFATPEGWDGSEVDACGNGVFSTSAALRKWVDARRQGLYLFVQSYMQLPNSIQNLHGGDMIRDMMPGCTILRCTSSENKIQLPPTSVPHAKVFDRASRGGVQGSEGWDCGTLVWKHQD